VVAFSNGHSGKVIFVINFSEVVQNVHVSHVAITSTAKASFFQSIKKLLKFLYKALPKDLL